MSKVYAVLKLANKKGERTSLPRPEWIRGKAPNSKGYFETLEIVKSLKLNTVCEEAACPNIGHCWAKKHATVMILGSICTRNCSFCNVPTGIPNKLDPHEPDRVAAGIAKLGLSHIVITSVDRDDLDDGGADHFVQCIKKTRALSPQTTIEILTPDFLRKNGALEHVVAARPDVFNHNVETIPRLYPTVRPGARYFHSLQLLHRAKQLDKTIFTKSGLMVGLGEDKDEVLQPTPTHAKVDRYVHPDEFEYYARMAKAKGFLMVSSSPLTRSSYHAGDDFQKMKAARLT